MSLSRTQAAQDHHSRPAAVRIAVAALLLGALAIVALALPGLPARAAAVRPRAGVPTVVLCGGYQGCNQAGYDSYGYGQHAGTSYWRMYAGDECTNYVAYVESTYFGVATPGYLLGNAYQWPASAAAHGVTVNTVPSVGAVAVWPGGAYGMGPDGHVAVVERVGPHDSYIVVSQQHLLGVANGYEWTQINAGFPASTWEPWPSQFIHFRVRTTVPIPPARGGGRHRSAHRHHARHHHRAGRRGHRRHHRAGRRGHRRHHRAGRRGHRRHHRARRRHHRNHRRHHRHHRRAARRRHRHRRHHRAR